VAGDVDQEDRVEDLPAERQARRIGNNEVGCRGSRPSPGEADGTGGDIDRSHAPGLPGECGEGLSVPASELQDGGTCRKVRERCWCTTPEVSPPPVILVPGRSVGIHGSQVGVAGE
jgi:hypothetical protein